MENSVIVIGGGISGMTAASELSKLGLDVTLIEKEASLGGHVADWDRLFPDKKKASDVVDHARKGLDGVNVLTGAEVKAMEHAGPGFSVEILRQGNNLGSDASPGSSPSPPGTRLRARAVVMAAGFDLFEARKKEEYGYGIYDNVITSADLEKKFRNGGKILTSAGKTPGKIGIVHCVGSRDEKAGNLYCSRVCCVTGVKQAIELKEMHPSAEIFSFYMDLRMFGRHFEELYYEAQQTWGINFIRGRVSECAENADGSVVVKTEDTLSGKPLKVTVDILVLLSGFVPARDTAGLCRPLGMEKGEDGFLMSSDPHLGDNLSQVPGLFLAGTVKGPASVADCIADSRAAALEVYHYLNKSLS